MKARNNPFSVNRVLKIRYRPMNTSIEQLVARLASMHYRAAVIGPEGSGKTTLLEDLQAYLDRQGRKTKAVFVNDTRPFTRSARKRFLSQLAPDDIVFLDGADGISRLAWLSFKRAVFKRAAGLIITAHRPALLPTLIECTTTAALLQSIVHDLLGPDKAPDREFLKEIFAAHNGNIRNCFRNLYDTYADPQFPSAVTWSHHASV